MSTEENEINLLEYYKVVKKYWRFILCATALVTIIAVVVLLLVPQKYEAKAIIRIGKVGDELLEKPPVIIEAMLSFTALKQVANELGYSQKTEEVAKLRTLIDINMIPGSNDLVVVRTRGHYPEQAEQLGNLICRKIIDRHTEIYEKSIKNFNNCIRMQIKSWARINPRPIIIDFSKYLNMPTVLQVSPTSFGIPIYPKRKKVVSICFVSVLLLSTFLTFVIESFSQKKNQSLKC